jgi:Leucine-rich repeat (LRR) protein
MHLKNLLYFGLFLSLACAKKAQPKAVLPLQTPTVNNAKITPSTWIRASEPVYFLNQAQSLQNITLLLQEVRNTQGSLLQGNYTLILQGYDAELDMPLDQEIARQTLSFANGNAQSNWNLQAVLKQEGYQWFYVQIRDAQNGLQNSTNFGFLLKAQNTYELALQVFQFQDEPDKYALELDLNHPYFQTPRVMEKGAPLQFYVALNGSHPVELFFTPDYPAKKAYLDLPKSYLANMQSVLLWHQEMNTQPVYAAQWVKQSEFKQRYNRACKNFAHIQNQNDLLKVPPFHLANYGLNDKGFVNSLILVNKGISSLPAELVCFQYLQTLDLGINQLTAIPNIRTLKNLTYLSFSDNKIAPQHGAYWYEFQYLNKLKYLNFNNNKLGDTFNYGTFPYLKNLEELHLAGNGMTWLFGLNTHSYPMRILNLSNNKLTALPDSFGYFNNITKLYLNNNQLKGNLSVLRWLKKLEELDVSYNNLTYLPGFAYTAPNIDLHMTATSYEELVAKTDKAFEFLRIYRANNNNFMYANLHPLNMISLEELYLNNTELRKLSAHHFWILKGLKILDLSGNPYLDKFTDKAGVNTFENLGKSGQMTYLKICGTKLFKRESYYSFIDLYDNAGGDVTVDRVKYLFRSNSRITKIIPTEYFCESSRNGTYCFPNDYVDCP